MTKQLLITISGIGTISKNPKCLLIIYTSQTTTKIGQKGDDSHLSKQMHKSKYFSDALQT